MNKKALLTKSIIALLLLITIINLYIPQSIYFAQREYFSGYFFNLVQPFLVYVLLVFGLVLVVLSLLPQKLLKYIVAMLLVISLWFWVYVDFFSVSYGVLDGSALNFSHFEHRGYIELGVLILSLLMALVFHKFVLKQFPFLAALVLMGLLVVIAANVIQEPNDKDLIEDVDKEFFNYSAKKNIILIVLDTFGSKYFQDIIKENPLVTKNYTGFVSYTDAISNYPATKGSVPSFLMGEMIPENVKYRTYLDDHVASRGLPNQMSESGYLVSMISVYRWFEGIFPERYIYQPQVSQENLTAFDGAQLLDFSLFRVLPHFAKPTIYNDGAWFFSQAVSDKTEVPNTFPEKGAALMKMMTENAVVDNHNPTPRFKIIHVTIPHPQYVYDKNCIKQHSNSGIPVSYLMSEQSRCALRFLDKLLHKYKDMGVYDNSVIVVTSDHGSRVLEDRGLTGFPSYFEMNTSGIMFMIKGINQTAAFQQVDNPFSLLELKDALQDEALHTTAYDFLSDNNRQFYAFRNNHKSAAGYLQDAPLYSVGKDFKQPDSWQLKRFVVNNCHKQILPLNLTFTKNGREGYCSLYGFDDPDGQSIGAWTKSIDSRVVLKIEDSFKQEGQSRTLKLNFTSRIHDAQKSMVLEVLVNGQNIGQVNIDNKDVQALSFDFSADILLKNELDVLQLKLPTVLSDVEMGRGLNNKKLGLLIESIELN